MSNRTVFEAAVVNAANTYLASADAAAVTRNGAYNTATIAFKAGGSYATYAAAIAAADKTYAATLDGSLQTKVSTTSQARDTWKTADGGAW
jgi:hypothetical protein